MPKSATTKKSVATRKHAAKLMSKKVVKKPAAFSKKGSLKIKAKTKKATHRKKRSKATTFEKVYPLMGEGTRPELKTNWVLSLQRIGGSFAENTSSHVPTLHSFIILFAFAATVGTVLTWFAATPAYAEEGLPPAGPELTRVYTSQYGFKLTYPMRWTANDFLVATGDSVNQSLVLKNGNSHVVIYTYKNNPSESSASEVDETEIGGLPAKVYSVADPITGTQLTRIVLVQSDNLTYEIIGSGPVFERVVDSLRFIN